MHKYIVRNESTDNLEELDGAGAEELQPAENETTVSGAVSHDY